MDLSLQKCALRTPGAPVIDVNRPSTKQLLNSILGWFFYKSLKNFLSDGQKWIVYKKGIAAGIKKYKSIIKKKKKKHDKIVLLAKSKLNGIEVLISKALTLFKMVLFGAAHGWGDSADIIIFLPGISKFCCIKKTNISSILIRNFQFLMTVFLYPS